MEAIAITLNGTPVSGRPGMTILELAREVGVKIPTLCHDPSLKPAGACRICLVEDEKSGRLLASCVTPIAPGMVINTESTTVTENRRIIVKLMLASHPESCLLCDKGNRCRLRGIAADLGIGQINYYKMPQYSGTREINPFILRDLSKCILCGKCIRADQELVVVGALDYNDRGFDAKPATTFEGPLETSECTFCGTCVSMCPTGALFEKGKPHLGSISARTASTCSYCGCGCSLFLETSENRLVSVSPNQKDSVNGATLCVKGHYGSDYIHHPDRLQKPLIRRNGELREAGWEEALDFVAEGLKSCHSRHGPENMAFFGSSKCTNEENYLFQKLARTVFGTNNIDNGARLHSGATIETLPFGAMTNPLHDLEHSDVILVVGSNPSASHPVAGYGIKRSAYLENAGLIVVDPVKTDLASRAAAWVPIRPGMDGVFLNGLLKGMLDSGVFDRELAKTKSEDIRMLKNSLAPFDPLYLEKWTGCPPALFESVLNIMTNARLPAIVYGHGITQQANAHHAIRAMIKLALLKDSLGKRGGGIYPLDKENNGQGAWDMGCMPDYLPGHQALDDEIAVRRIEDIWGKPVPRKPGLRAAAMFQGAMDGNIKAMFIIGENPARAFPNRAGIESTLSRLDFLVVQDLFLTETAEFAHAVLPACSFAEKEGTFTSLERRIQPVRKAMEPLHHSRPDWKILCGISAALGQPMHYGSAMEITREIALVVPLYSGLTPERLESGGAFWSVSGVVDEGKSRLSPGGWGEDGALLAPARVMPMEGEKEEGFLLVRGSTLYQFLGGTRSLRSRRLAGVTATRRVFMNPLDARELGMEDGDRATIFDTQAEAAVTIVLSDPLPQGMLLSPYFDQSLSSLNSLSRDPAATISRRVHIRKEG